VSAIELVQRVDELRIGGKIRRAVRAIGLPQGRYEGIAVLTRDLPILVTVTVVEAELQFMFSCIAGSGHSGFL
jgi:hypothetical protein